MSISRNDIRRKLIILMILGVILPLVTGSISSFQRAFPIFVNVIYIAVGISIVAFIYYVIKYVRVDRWFIAAPIVLLVVSAGVIVWSVPFNRTVFSSSGEDPPLYPDYLSGNFSVIEAETGIHEPRVIVAVDLNMNGEYVDVCIQFCLLNYTLDQLGLISNISDILDEEHKIGRFWYLGDPPTMEFHLPNVPCSYVWVLWVEADYIPSVWTLDIALVLEFSMI